MKSSLNRRGNEHKPGIQVEWAQGIFLQQKGMLQLMMIEYTETEIKIIQKRLAIKIFTLYEIFLEKVSQMWKLAYDTTIS
jgi:hypothetical protein